MGVPTDPTDGRGPPTPGAVGERVRSLPEASRRLLHLAAGLGTGFDLGSLAVVAGRSRESIAADLQPALEAELVAVNGVAPVTLGETPKPPVTLGETPKPPARPGEPHRSDVLVFIVPVEQVYGLIPAGDLPALHLR